MDIKTLKDANSHLRMLLASVNRLATGYEYLSESTNPEYYLNKIAEMTEEYRKK